MSVRIWGLQATETQLADLGSKGQSIDGFRIKRKVKGPDSEGRITLPRVGLQAAGTDEGHLLHTLPHPSLLAVSAPAIFSA